MSKSTITYLTDDLDGSDADDTIKFSLEGRSYEIDLNKKNAALLRKALKPFVTKARSASRPTAGTRRRGTAKKSGAGKVTLFSKLDQTEKERFRKWAKLPVARRIADERVQAWAKAGRP